MDYSKIDSIMVNKGIAADPAFDALHFFSEPMPNLNGCPLGLYYPSAWQHYPAGSIVLPSDATTSALLHELGHRHGHFYYGDLSEGYAENYRRGFEKGKALLYSGNHIENLPKFGVLFNEGERGTVEIVLAHPPSMDELANFKSRVLAHQVSGEKVPRFFYGGNDDPWVRVEFTQGASWLVIIGAVMAASVLATVGAIGYSVYKVSDDLPWIVPVSVLGTGMFLLMRAMARETVKRVPAKIGK